MAGETPESKHWEELAAAIEPGSRVLRARPLAGGVSAEVTALEIAGRDGTPRTLVVRRHGPADLAANPQIAADEFRLLAYLHTRGMPVPQPLYVDPAGAITGSPCLVTTFMPGSAGIPDLDLDDVTRQLAEHLAGIHHFDGAGAELSFLPLIAMRYARLLAERPARLDTTIEEERIRAVLRAAWPFPQHNGTALLHGDFWPGNLLWHNRRITAILDWEDAAIGDPLADLANTRLEILWALGQAAMQRFTSHYLARMALDMRALPVWDLCAALRPAGKIDNWAADETAAQAMRERHAWFCTQAFALLDPHDKK